jgi:hypothetical protein
MAACSIRIAHRFECNQFKFVSSLVHFFFSGFIGGRSCSRRCRGPLSYRGPFTQAGSGDAAAALGELEHAAPLAATLPFKPRNTKQVDRFILRSVLLKMRLHVARFHFAAWLLLCMAMLSSSISLALQCSVSIESPQVWLARLECVHACITCSSAPCVTQRSQCAFSFSLLAP